MSNSMKPFFLLCFEFSIMPNFQEISQTPEINWFPGHMLKAKKALAQQIRRVDVVLELCDARLPLISSNQKLLPLLQNKRRILLCNKTQLANAKATASWKQWFQQKKESVLFIDTKENKNVQKIIPLARSMMQEKWGNYQKKGIRPPALRMMIVGIPNVGKSSLINRLVKRHATQTGPKPGVTRHQEWVLLGKDIELLDTPGILWPKIANDEVGMRLTLTGAIKDSIVGVERLSRYLIELTLQQPQELQRQYRLSDATLSLPAESVLEVIARNRGCLKSSESVDWFRVGELILYDFRAGKLGRVTLEQHPSLNF